MEPSSPVMSHSLSESLQGSQKTLMSHNSSLDRAKKESTRTKSLIIAALLVCNFAAQSLYMNVVALLPQYVADHFPESTSFMVGVLMAVYPVAFLFTAPLVGNYMQKVGRKNMVLLGVILMSLATLMFGLGSLGSTEKVFFIVSFIARLLQGTGDAAIGVSISSIIAIEFPENLEQYMGYLNMSLGAGLCLGPLMGSVVFRYFNYLDTFYLFTAYIFIIGIASVSIIPKRVNTVVQQTEDSASISFGFILYNKRSFTAMILCIVAIISIVYLDPILAVQLTSMGMNEDNVGFVFAIIGGAFGVGSPVSGWVCTRVNRTIVMQLAIVMLPFSILLCGPSAFLGLPDVIWIMMIGIFMLGWSAAFLFVPVTPEIIESTTIWQRTKLTKELTLLGLSHSEIIKKVEQEIAETSCELADKASAIQQMSFALGSFVAPIIGGKLNDVVGFRETSDIMAIFALCCGVINFAIIFLPSILTRHKNQDKIEAEDEILSESMFTPKNREF